MSNLTLVFGDWLELGQPTYIGSLRSSQIRIGLTKSLTFQS